MMKTQVNLCTYPKYFQHNILSEISANKNLGGARRSLNTSNSARKGTIRTALVCGIDSISLEALYRHISKKVPVVSKNIPKRELSHLWKTTCLYGTNQIKMIKKWGPEDKFVSFCTKISNICPGNLGRNSVNSLNFDWKNHRKTDNEDNKEFLKKIDLNMVQIN